MRFPSSLIKKRASAPAGVSPAALDPWPLLDRFLLFGTEAGTYHASAPRLTPDQALNAVTLIKSEGLQVVARCADVSRSGRAPKNGPAVYTLALAASFGDAETRRAAFDALPTVCRTGADLIEFVQEASALRGWGRGMRRAVGDWYARADVDDLALQALKDRRRGGWSHRDLLRLAHPKPPDEAHRVLYKWIVDGELTGANPRIEAAEALSRLSEGQAVEAARIVREHRLVRECVPISLLRSPLVWEALLVEMSLTGLARNLGNMTRVGLLTPGSASVREVVDRLGNAALIRRARVHPVSFLLARASYSCGASWEPVPEVLAALDRAFDLATEALEPTGRRWFVAADVSGSMDACTVAASPLKAREAALAMALLTARVDAATTVTALEDGVRPLPVSSRTTLTEAMGLGVGSDFGATDCALPILHATRKRIEVDAFMVLTDRETWFGDVHPARALADYRQRTGVAARLVVVGLAGEPFQIADPGDPGMLDVVGFDPAVPLAVREFALSSP